MPSYGNLGPPPSAQGNNYYGNMGNSSGFAKNMNMMPNYGGGLQTGFANNPPASNLPNPSYMGYNPNANKGYFYPGNKQP